MKVLRKGKTFTVYYTENSSKEKVILKMINSEYLNDKEKYQKILKQFQIEKEILKQLDFDFMPNYQNKKDLGINELIPNIGELIYRDIDEKGVKTTQKTDENG